jgi:hypothetical protein
MFRTSLKAFPGMTLRLDAVFNAQQQGLSQPAKAFDFCGINRWGAP